MEKLFVKDGEEMTKTKETDEVSLSPCATIFDSKCPAWENNLEKNLQFLEEQERIANDLLRDRGYLFINEVYDMLGIPKTKYGQIVGWIYDDQNSIGDNYVFFDIYMEQNSDFINEHCEFLILDFNVDGNILDRI